jgi:AcrR family transcriptional regulator
VSAKTERSTLTTEPLAAAKERALLEATVRLLGRGGVAVVTHRAVAREAGVSLGSRSCSPPRSSTCVISSSPI